MIGSDRESIRSKGSLLLEKQPENSFKSPTSACSQRENIGMLESTAIVTEMLSRQEKESTTPPPKPPRTHDTTEVGKV